MFGKRILIVLTDFGKRCLTLLPVVILLSVMLNAIVLTNVSTNPLESISIIIDSTYESFDDGNNSNTSSFENEVVIDISENLRQILSFRKAFTNMTVSSDMAVDKQVNPASSMPKHDLSARLGMINSMKYDLFVSIHVDPSLYNYSAGPVTIYSSKFPESLLLAKCLQKKINAFATKTLNKKFNNTPIKSKNNYLLANSHIPGAIIDVSFMANPEGKKMLLDGKYRQKLSVCIADGIKDYLQQLKKIKW